MSLEEGEFIKVNKILISGKVEALT